MRNWNLERSDFLRLGRIKVRVIFFCFIIRIYKGEAMIERFLFVYKGKVFVLLKYFFLGNSFR